MRVEPPPSPASVRAVEGTDLDARISAKKRMCRLLQLDPARAWTPDAEQGLAALLPIPEDEWRAVEWLHAQPDDGRRRPKLRSSPDSLTQHWQGEVSKARRLAADLGETLASSEKSAGPEPDPEGWVEFLAALDWHYIPYLEAVPSVRREFREKRTGVAA